MDDCDGCENPDEEAVAMIEESPSGIIIILNQVGPINLYFFISFGKIETDFFFVGFMD